MEILYVKATGRVIAVQEDGFAWGHREAVNGVGVESFGLLHRSMPLPNASQDALWVRGNRVEVRDLPADPRPEV